MNRSVLVYIAALSAGSLACSGEHPVSPSVDDSGAIAGFTISNSVVTSTTSSDKAASRTSSGSAYVSAAPHTFSDQAQYASITNETAGAARVSQAIIDGGFDPVKIDGNEGDAVSVAVFRGSDNLLSIVHTRVPPRRPPRVVRTSPGKGRVDVALTTMVEIVFSEPIDRTSVTPASVRLLKGQLPVDGSILVSADGLVVQFTPVNDLDPSATYSLLLTSALRDLDGEQLDDPPSLEFTTASLPLQGMIAFVSTRDGNPEIYTSNVDGTDVRRLTNTVVAESDPEWSPDGSKLVFSRSRIPGPGSESDIYIMDADGSNVVPLTDGGINYQPSWSPDGSRVAYVVDRYFGGQTRIRVQRVDEDISKSIYVGYDTGWNGDPVWSPDGVFILFATDWYLYDDVTQLVKVRADGTAPPTLLPLAPPWNLRVFYLQPSWHNSSIVFAECDWFYACGGPGSISITDRDGFTQRRLIQTSNIRGMTWSPDGAFIAYSAQSCRECTPPSIFYISSDGSSRGLIISNAFSPSWRPSAR